MDDDGLFFSRISTFGKCLAATCLLGFYLGLLRHGRAVTSDAVQGLQNWDCCSLTGELLDQMRYWGSATGTVAVSRARAEAPQYFVLLSTTMHCDTVQLLRQPAFSTRCAHARRQLMQPWLCGTPKSSRLLVLDPFATKLGMAQAPAPASRAIRKDHHTQAGHLPGQRTSEHHRRRFLPLTSDAKARRLASPPMAT